MHRISLVIALMLALAPRAASAQDWNVDTSGCDVALERFFYNGTENRTNLQRIWYEGQGREVLSAFLNAGGTERTRKTYRYDEHGIRVEYSMWDRAGTGWRLWYHASAQRRMENGLAVYTEHTSRYAGEPVLSAVTRLRPDGTLAYEARYNGEGDYSITHYDGRGNMLSREYEHEKTDGVVRERYVYRYEGDRILSFEKLDESGALLSTTVNTWEGGFLVAQEVRQGASGKSERIRYFYHPANGKLVRQEWLDPASGTIRYALYYEYDAQGRLVKSGEWSPGYERYWLYEFE